jgi:hypothetical protein
MDVPVDLAGSSLGVMSRGPYNLMYQDNNLLIPPRLSLAQILTPRESGHHHRPHLKDPRLVHRIHHRIQRRRRWLLLGLLRATRQPQTLAIILLLVGIRCLIMVIGLILLTPTRQLHHRLRLPYPLSMNCCP